MRSLHVLVAIAALLIVISPVRAARPVTTVLLRNPADQPIRNVPTAFGQGSKKGDIKKGVVVKAGAAEGQVDETLWVFERLLPDWYQQLTIDPTFAISPRKTGK